MVAYVLLSVFGALGAVVLWAGLQELRALRGSLGDLRASQAAPSEPQAPAGAISEQLVALTARVTEVEILARSLPSLWEEERERAVKAQKRAAEAEARHRRSLEESEGDMDLDPQLQAELGSVLSAYAAGGPSEGVHAMRSGVGESHASLQARAHAALARDGVI